MFDDAEEMNAEVAGCDETAAPDEARKIDELEHSIEDGISEPYLGMVFNSEHSAKDFYKEYAKRLGFIAKNGECIRSKMNGSVVSQVFVCSTDSITQRCAESCKALLKIERKDEDKWIVTTFARNHNHEITARLGKVNHIRSRHVPVCVTKGESSPLLVQAASMNASSNRSKSYSSSSYCARSNAQKRTLGKDAQILLEYFKSKQAENPGFFYAVQLDEDTQLRNVFWADIRCRTAYTHFADTLTFDTSYKLNQYKVPFAFFTGINHHGHIILFGCAILLDESETSFIWLFKTFLTAMHGKKPVSITTDQDSAIQTAVSQVFSDVRHCVNKWHVLRDVQEKLAVVCFKHPNFQYEFYNCIILSETVAEFESCWSSITDKDFLRGHTWLESLYYSRAKWVPAYFKDSFFGAIFSNQEYGTSFFDGFVNQQTTLPMLLRQYERALARWFEKEQNADHDTICSAPTLKTPSPMEKQAADVYSKRVFSKFQEELVETFVYTANQIEENGAISLFKVAKFEDDRKAYFVTFNFIDITANCSCKMFEHSGILCRHILTVFTVTNILTLPEHYILKRWTMNAKNGTRIEKSGALEKFRVRYNNLCREGIKFAEESSATMETYNAALRALNESKKKIAIVRKSAANNKLVPFPSDTTPLLWPQSVADLNLPYMAPISLQQDESPGNMVALPSLKSMTWAMEDKISSDGSRIAGISLKLQDNSKSPVHETEVKFKLSKLTLEPMLKSMAYISDQLWSTANKVAIINLKLQETDCTSGESEVKFQVSGDTLSAMLRSMAYIREQLTTMIDPHLVSCTKRQKL